MNNSFVYCWSDKTTSKVYVGVHKGHEEDGYICSSKHMKKAYEERPNDFSRKIITKGFFKDCAELEIRINRELLKNLNTCYNRCAGKAIINDEATRKLIGRKVSERSKGRIVPPEVGRAISKAKKGVKFSEEHKIALSKAQTGRKDSPERVAVRALSLKGINKKPKTEEHKAKIKENIRLLWRTQKYREMMLAARMKKAN